MDDEYIFQNAEKSAFEHRGARPDGPIEQRFDTNTDATPREVNASEKEVPAFSDTQSFLDHCTPEFARSWRHVEQARPLLGGFIDAMALVEFRRNGEAQVVLEGPGFGKLFGLNAQERPNFVICADRQDRENLLSACRSAAFRGPSIHVDVAWSVGDGLHSGDSENFFNTITSIEHVGHLDDSKLLYFAFRDVSARRTAEHGLSRSRIQSALRALFDEIFLLNLDTGASEPIYAGGRPLVNDDGTPIECGFHAIFKTLHHDDIQLFWKYSNYTNLERELFGEGPRDAITFDLRRKGEADEFHWTRIYICRIASADSRKNVLVCCQNIDEQKDAQRRERELRSKAQTDALTRIYNRGTSEELIRTKLQGLQADQTVVFAIVDVDDFKRVNDTYGHATGDEVLKAVAHAVRETCREDDIVGRLGGDEFVALFSGNGTPSQTQLLARFERCKEQVRDKSAALGIDPPVTLSIGAVTATASDNVFSEVFDHADSLLYEVKRCGKDALRIDC